MNIFGGLLWLTFRWIANPPGPPLGKTELDRVVKFFIQTGTTNVLIVGTLAVGAFLLWAIASARSPPMLQVFQREQPAPDRDSF